MIYYLIPIAIVLIVLVVVLYFVGKKLQKRQEESDKLMEANKQNFQMMIIDKKTMKMKDAGFPAVILENTPKLLRGRKIPVVKVKIGPKIMTLMCDDKIFKKILPKQTGQGTVSGIFLKSFKRTKGPVYTEPEKKKGLARFFKKK